jgi:hypothetical protein
MNGSSSFLPLYAFIPGTGITLPYFINMGFRATDFCVNIFHAFLTGY